MFEIHTVYIEYIFIHKCVFLGCLPPINHFVKLVPVLHFFPELQVCMVNGIEEGSLIGAWNSISTMQDMVIGPGVFFSVSGRNAVSPGIQIKIDLGKLGNLSTGLLDFSHWDKESQINRHLVVVISHLVVVHSWRMWIYHRILFFFWWWEPWKERLEWGAKFEEPPEFPKSNGVVTQFAVFVIGTDVWVRIALFRGWNS